MVMHDADRNKVLLVTSGLAAMAMTTSLCVTAPHGLAIETDGAFYYQAARSFWAGQGFLNYYKDGLAHPMTHFPPAYAVALSFGHFLGLGLESWARTLQSLLFGVNIALISLLTWLLVPRFWAVVLTGSMALLSVHLLQLHVTTISEPLFFAFSLSALGLLIRYADSCDERTLFLSAALAGLAALTRYAGVAMVLTVGAVALIFSRRKGLARLRTAILAAAFASLVPGLWIVRNMLLTRQPVGFRTEFSWQPLSYLGRLLDTFSQYLLPAIVAPSIRGALAAVALGVLALLLMRVWRMTPASAEERKLRVAWQVVSVFWAIYLITVLAAIASSGGSIQFDPRISLVWPLSALVLVPSCFRLNALRSLRPLVMAVIAVTMALMLARSIQLGVRIHRDGYGYNFRQWKQARLVSELRKVPANIPLYASDPEAVYLYTGRSAVLIPHDGINADFFPTAAKVRSDFRQGAVAVIFDERNFNPDPVWWRVARSLNLKLVFEDGWGRMYSGISMPRQTTKGQ